MTPTTTSGRRPRAANADLAAQMKRLHALMSAPAAAYPGSVTGAASTAQEGSHPPRRQLFDLDELAQRKRWADRLPTDSQKVVRAQLDLAEKLGAWRRVAIAPSSGDFADLKRDFPHFRTVTAALERRALLCRRAPEPVHCMPPLLLTGPPGLGKSVYVKALAQLLGVPHHEIDGATLTAGFSLSGLDIGYASGRPGQLWDALQNECMSPCVTLDEIDKAPNEGAYPALGCLYSLLEMHSARRFRDAAMGLTVDASWISWIATCNHPDALDSALLSRFEVFDIAMPSTGEMAAVVDSVQRGLAATANWMGSFEPGLRENVVAALCALTPRVVRRVLEDAYARAAAADRDYLVPEDIRPTDSRLARPPIGFI